MPFWRRLQESLFEGFWISVRSVGLLSLVGMAGGVCLVLLGKTGPLHQKYDVVALVIEHLGMGFIVSSIAVFGYEWRAHSKKTIDLSERLERLLTVEGEAALDRALGELIPSDNRKLPLGAEDVSSNCKTVILSISNLLATKRRVDEHYVNFVSGLLKSVVKKNAEELVDLHRKQEAKFKVPATAAVLADDILAAQMSAMERGESYRVISDLGSWANKQLEDFHEASREAVQRGVRIERIFNLHDMEIDASLSGRDIRKILSKHVQAMNSWKDKRGGGGYEARIFGPREKRASDDLRIPEAKLKKMHFGIFIFSDDEVARFLVTEPDLSEIRINRDPDDVNSDRENFDILWGSSVKLSSEVIERVVRDYEAEIQKDSVRVSQFREADLTHKLGDFILEQLDAALAQEGEAQISRASLGEGVEFRRESLFQQSYSLVSIRCGKNGDGSQRELVLPSTKATFGDLILSSQMRRLSKGDTYSAISDLPSWQGRQLVNFREETESAVRARGVVVRRIFHVLGEEALSIDQIEIAKIIGQHIKDAFRWSSDVEPGCYEVRFFGVSELSSALNNGLDIGRVVKVEDFGIVSKSTGKVRLGVLARDMGRLEFSRISDVVMRDESLFQILWDHSTDLTEAKIPELLAELKRGE